MPETLSVKQELFAKEYAKDGNGLQAAIRAGYSEKTAAAQASRLLNNVNILNQIRIEKDKQLERVDISADRILQELAYTAFADTTDYVTVETELAYDEAGNSILDHTGEPAYIQSVKIKDTSELSAIQRKAIQSIKAGKDGIELKLHDKIKATELLGKHLKLFTEKVEQQNSGEISIKLNVPAPKGE
jgi:phage terminase small subunit